MAELTVTSTSCTIIYIYIYIYIHANFRQRSASLALMCLLFVITASFCAFLSRAQKRMGGEDVFGSKITVTLETPLHQHHGSSFERLSGPNLSKSFPPHPRSPPPNQQRYPQLTPPPPQRKVPLYPMPPAPYGPGAPVAEPRPMGMPPHPMGMPPRPMGMPPRPMGIPSPPNPHPLRFPPQPPPAHGPPHVFQHNVPPPRPTNPSHPPYAAHGAVQQPPRVPPPQGKILIFKLPPVSETELDGLNGHVVRMRLAASIKVSFICFICGYEMRA